MMPGDDAHVEELPALGELRQHPRQRDAVQVLHHDEPDVADVAELVDLADVGVGELRGQVGLVAEHRDEVLVVGEVGQDALDHLDRLPGPLLAREEDLGHAAGRQLGEQLELAEHAVPRRRDRRGHGGPHADATGRITSAVYRVGAPAGGATPVTRGPRGRGRPA
jgi:hypothetical protein